MKNLKLLLLSFIVVAFSFTSCTNDEPINNDEQQVEESASITTAMDELSSRFSENGTIILDQNPSGNIIFDFCFDFVYPLTLSYNNDTTVTVNNFDELIEVIISSTEELYIDGISFPFDVETYNDETDAIEIQTINNEEEFVALLDGCDFDDNFDCECSEVFDPVCVEIEDPNGESFLITYPNACYAECDGFTEEDFAEDCEEDYNCPGGTECFDFNFPLTIVTDDGETITVNSQEELDTVLYDAYYFDFVYPFSVTLDDDDDTVVTINNEEEFYNVLVGCYDDIDDDAYCDCTYEYDPVCVEVEWSDYPIEFPNACIAECEGFSTDDFVDCGDNGSGEDCDCNYDYDPVCVETGGGIVVFPNECIAECEGFTENDFVDCEDDNNGCGCTDVENPVCVEFETATGQTEIITFLNECIALCEGFTPEDFIDCE